MSDSVETNYDVPTVSNGIGHIIAYTSTNDKLCYVGVLKNNNAVPDNSKVITGGINSTLSFVYYFSSANKIAVALAIDDGYKQVYQYLLAPSNQHMYPQNCTIRHSDTYNIYYCTNGTDVGLKEIVEGVLILNSLDQALNVLGNGINNSQSIPVRWRGLEDAFNIFIN